MANPDPPATSNTTGTITTIQPIELYVPHVPATDPPIHYLDYQTYLAFILSTNLPNPQELSDDSNDDSDWTSPGTATMAELEMDSDLESDSDSELPD